MKPDSNSTNYPTPMTASSAFAWLVFSIVAGASVYEWGNNLNWELDSITTYSLFPLLGLLAWSIMWTHYFIPLIASLNPKLKASHVYKRSTAYVALFLILMHPGLLAFAQWQNQQLLPPSSFIDYVGKANILMIVIAELALLTFISFELLIRLKNHPFVKRHWIWVSFSQMIAMILIFVHSLALGQNLQSGPFKFYWLGLGLLMIPSFICIGIADWKHSRS